MSKRNVSAPLSPDVTYDTDEDGTKVIIRKFDIPLPSKQGKISASEKKLEKWKYQHDVPEGKIFTKRVHAKLSPTTSPQSGKNETSNIPSSSVSPKVLPTNIQNIQLVKASAPTHKDVTIVQSKEPSTLVAPAPKSICSDKITLNNLPENVIANSIKVFDSKFVNGRKVLYLKAVKDVGKVLGNSVKSGTEVILTQNDINTSHLKCLSGTSASGTAVVNPMSIQPKELKCYYPSRVQKTIEKTVDELQGGTPSTLSQKLKFTSREVPVGNILEHIPVVCDDCDHGSKKTEVQVNKSISAIVPSTLQHPNMHTVSLLTQNKREVMPCAVLTAETLPKFRSGILKSVLRDPPNNSREIHLQINSLKTNGHILIDASKPKVNLSEGNINVVGVEFLNSGSNNLSPIDNVDNQSVLKDGKLKFVPADSTTPSINVCTSVHQNTDNHSSTESILIVNKENLDKEHLDTAVIGSQMKSNSLIDSNNIYNNEGKNSIENIVIVNPSQSVTSTNTAAVPKKNVDEIMRRRKIALKFQQDMQRAKETPRIERKMLVPSRVINVVESSTQTSLFCMLEPGRMVEMIVNDNCYDSKIPKQSSSQDTYIGMEWNQSVNERNPTFISKAIQPYEATNCTTVVNDQMDSPLSKRIRLDNPVIESVEGRNDSCDRIMNNDPLLTTSMDFEDLIIPFESLGKENITTTTTNIRRPSKIYKTHENENQYNHNNINSYSSPLACMQSTLNSNVNSAERNLISNCNTHIDNAKFVLNKEMMKTIVKDYRDSLIPDEDGNLPLHNAVMDRDVKQVQRRCLVLSAQKQSVDVKNKMKETALHLAVLCHDLQIVKVLLKFSARPDVPDGEGNTPVHMAIIWGNNIDILQALLASTEDNSPTLNLPNDEGFSPLHLCALHNKPSEASLLVKKNVEVNIKDRKSGRTPLFHAVENGNTEMSQVLLDAGAHTQIPNFSGQTALNASELTFVLDQLAKIDSPKISKAYAVPCVCQEETNEDRTSNISLNKTVFERTDLDVLNSNTGINNINLFDNILHNR